MKKIFLIILFLTSACLASWITPISISGPSDYVEDPHLIVDSSGNLHAFWANLSTGGLETNLNILYRYSNDSGITWSSTQEIYNEPSVPWSGESFSIDVNSSEDLIFVTSLYNTPYSDIFFSTSSDGGITWSPFFNISNNTGDSVSPELIIDSSGIYVVWTQTGIPNQIFFSKSTDGGVTWTPGMNASRTAGNSARANIAIDSNDYLYLVWDDYYDLFPAPNLYGIHFSKSTDGGATWSTAINVSASSDESYSPVIAVSNDGNNLHIMWKETVGSDKFIYYSNSSDGGLTWSDAYLIDEIYHGAADFFDIAVDSNDAVHVIWSNSDVSDNYANVSYMYSSDNGATWNSKTVISNGLDYTYAYQSSLYIDDSNKIYCVYSTWDSPDWIINNIDFTSLFSTPSKTGFNISDINGNPFDFNSTSLKINNNTVNITWTGLNASQVYLLNNKNLSSSISVSFGADSSSIAVNESVLNISANVTITGLSGITNPTITHDGVAIYENGARTAENNDTTDLLSEPTFADGTLTMEVGSFSEWSVEEGASSATENLTISAPENEEAVMIIFAVSLSMFCLFLKKG